MPPGKENDLKSLLEAHGSAKIGMAICDLASSVQILVNPDLPFHPASTFKIAVMMEVFHQAGQAKFDLEDLLPVKNSFRSISDGSEFSLSPQDDSESDLYKLIGGQASLRDLTRRMIIHSSNFATNLLIEKVGAENVTRYMQDLGAKDLIVRRGPEDNKAYALGLNNSATPRSLMQVLVQLEKRRVVSQAASDEMIDILLKQRFNEGIPSRLPAGTHVAHKTGWNDMLYHDAAIIYPVGRAPYVVSIMTSGLSEATEAPSLVATLSLAIYTQFTSA